MCTLVLAWQVFEETPVAVAANRDEMLERESSPPARREWGSAVVAPKDTVAGGTWLGYNEHGVLVAITNRWLDTERNGDRSRGLLVRDALGEDSAEAAARTVEQELDERQYDGFNLVMADRRAAILIESGHARRVTTLDPGVHVVVNVGVDGRYQIPDSRADVGQAQAQNADRVWSALRPEPGEGADAWLERAGGVLGDHEYGVCIHRDTFGTQSSSLVALGADGAEFRYADGPPCETPFEPVNTEL